MAAEVRPIRTKRNYEAALKEIGRLWGSKTGTREGSRGDLMSPLDKRDAALTGELQGG